MKFHSLCLAVLVALAGSLAPSPSPAAGGTAATADYGSIHLISSSHQDTAWMDTPAYCRNFRIEKNIIPALEMMKKDPNYKFTMECMLHLMEFLEAHPERTNEIIELTRAGRFEWGATFNQPYEDWLSGEELVRQLYYGRRWLKKNFPGCDARVYFNPDVPARSLQMQQILARAGVPYMIGSRYTAGLYNWQSPDGSGIIFWSPGHYVNHSLIIRGPAPLAAWNVNRELRRLGGYYLDRGIPPAYPFLNSADFSEPRNFSPLIKFWNGPLSPWRITEGYQPPKMQYSSAAEFFGRIAAGKHLTLDRRLGVRPDVWAYITGPTHADLSLWKRIRASSLIADETENLIGCLFERSRCRFSTLDNGAWKNLLYVDHGIGGKNGHISDVVFFNKVFNAIFSAGCHEGEYLCNPSSPITDRIKISIPETGFADFILNTGSNPVTTEMIVGLGEQLKKGAIVLDPTGAEVPFQITDEFTGKGANIAALWMKTLATADSSYGDDYLPSKAIDGKWEVGESNPELGPAQGWQSRSGSGPHWLMIDFGHPWLIHQVVIRHFGCIGKFGAETRLTTADFRVQGANSSDGPWTDLVEPIYGNTLPLTSYHFKSTEVRFLRLYITRGTQAGGDGAARILEIQALTEFDENVGLEALLNQDRGELAIGGWEPRIVFLARDIPPVGYSTFVIAPGKSSLAADPAITATDDRAENKFYRLTFAPGGVKSIYDKEQGRELLNTEKWLAGEVFTMLSVAPQDRLRGTDAGEFGSMPLPAMDGAFDRLANHKPEWKLVESGPVRAVWEATTQMADAEVRSRVSLWHGIKRIDFDIDLINFNGRPWREWRMAFPLGLDSPQLAYEVPMGVVRIGKDEVPGIGGYAYPTVTYSDEIKTIHPRQVQRWIDASDGKGGVTISTSASVFDWIDPTGSLPYPVIQPVLLASRKSCNGQGNWYPQAGDHHYRFSLTSHPGDWTQGWREAIGGQGILVGHLTSANASNTAMTALPPTLSFFSLSAPNVLITAIKKAEDDDDVVVRMVEMEGRDTEVTLRTHFKIEGAARTNLIEEDPQPIPAGSHEVTIRIGHNAIETLKLKMR